jgi:D-threonate/D-erythronate kinase
MIAVIADDFTGAAELGGIGLGHGIDVEINTAVNPHSSATLLVVDANSRSANKEEAVRQILKPTEELAQLKPELIYKKTDSVLRGHIIAELQAQLKVLKMSRALLVPANPYLGRTIESGIYYYGGQPVHESSFSTDPEFAITSSDVREMLKSNGEQVHVAKVGDRLPPAGIIVGEAKAREDLDYWAGQCGKDILPAGAAGFFSAILNNSNITRTRNMTIEEAGLPALYVSGTTFERSTSAIKKMAAEGAPVSYMQDDNTSWFIQIVEYLNRQGKAIIAIDPETTNGNPVALREKTAWMVKEVLAHKAVRELFIEGGSTARAIFDQLGYTSFFPVQTLSEGVIRMTVKERKGIYITVKPGSYAWPDGTWHF